MLNLMGDSENQYSEGNVQNYCIYTTRRKTEDKLSKLFTQEAKKIKIHPHVGDERNE